MRVLEFDVESPLVLFAPAAVMTKRGSDSLDDPLCTADIFVGGMRDWGAQVLVKPHPVYGRDKLNDKIVERLNASGNRAVLVDSEACWQETCDLLNACDVLVSRESTMVLEAAVIGKPVITIFPSFFKSDFSFHKISIAVCSAKQLDVALKRILFDEEFVGEFEAKRLAWLQKNYGGGLNAI